MIITSYEKTLSQPLEKFKDEFLNSTYKKQILLYRLALQLEYYETLAEIIKLKPHLPEEFLDDVENIKY